MLMTKPQPSFIRASFGRCWRRLADSAQILDFRNEAAAYLAQDRVLPGVVRNLQMQLKISATHRLISAIPCSGAETVDMDAIAGHIRSFAACGGHVVIFVNTCCARHRLRAKSLRTDFDRRLGRLCPPGSFSVVSHDFEHPVPIGTIRAALCDAIIARTFELGIADPIIVSNDADGLFTPLDYGARVLDQFTDPRRDIVTGPLYYGYAPWGESFLDADGGGSLPELMLGNRVLEARRRLRLSGRVDGGPFFTTEGPHTAFRAAAYCAAGGYDASLVRQKTTNSALRCSPCVRSAMRHIHAPPLRCTTPIFGLRPNLAGNCTPSLKGFRLSIPGRITPSANWQATILQPFRGSTGIGRMPDFCNMAIWAKSWSGLPMP